MTHLDSSILDRVFRALADSRRRVVLTYLLDTEEGTASFDELVDTVIDAETHSPSPDQEAIAISLHHNHLELLAVRGLVEYDRERGVITMTDRCAQVEPYLDFVPEIGQIFADG